MHRKLVYVCLLFVMSITTVALQAQQTPQKAVKQYELGLYVQASFSLEDYLSRGEVDKMFYVMLADCYDKMNEPQRAIQVLEKMDSKFDLTVNELTLWGQNLKKLESYEAARAVFAKIAAHDKDLSNYLMATCDVEDMESLVGNAVIHTLPINTEKSDFGPTMLKGKLVFSSSRNDILRAEQVNTIDRNAFQNQLYQVTVDSDAKLLGSPSFLRSDLKDYYNNGPVTYAPEAGTAVFVQNNFIDGQTHINPKDKSAALYLAEVDASGDWEKTYSFPYNAVGYSNIFPHLTDNGQTLYFASNMPGGEGGYDIYKSDFVDGNWTKPVNMGPVVNTVGDEVSPFTRGDHLYFASNWHRGLGGLDIYRVETGETYQVIEHLGKGINSCRDDYGLVFSEDEDLGFFTSNRTGGKGLEDIYGFSLKPTAHFAAVLEGESEVITAAAEVEEPVLMNGEKEKETTESEVTTTTMETASAETLKTKEETAKATTQSTEELISATEFEIVPYTGQDLSEDEEKRTVYSIQIAAFSRDWGGYEELAGKLRDIGKVYKVYYANMIKIRVGTYNHESEARKDLAIVKSRGFNDAFLVREELVIKRVPKDPSRGAEVTPKVVDKTYVPKAEKKQPEIKADPVLRAEPPVAKEDAGTKEEFQIDEERLKDMPVYRIRVAAYTTPEWFNKKKVDHLGKIYKEEQGEWHIFYLGDFKTIEEAEKVKTQVKDAGYNAAQMYMLRDGELIKVR